MTSTGSAVSPTSPTTPPTNDTWKGDACSLVEAFRRGDRSPVEELQATYAAIEASDLNAFSFLAREEALAAARAADVWMPFGGVPVGVKELDQVEGWPNTHACVVFKDDIADYTALNAGRIRDNGGAVLVGLTTASEFGGVNVTRTVLNGVTHNPWQHGRTPGGSSGGSAAAVAGGLVTLATAGDGGGSIRIPAGFCGLVGLKATFGRIPRGPHLEIGNYTTTVGCVSRSVRDTARWFDVANGHHGSDPMSLQRTSGWEVGLGTHGDALKGMRVSLAPEWGGAVVSPAMWTLLAEVAHGLIADAQLQLVDGIDLSTPSMGAAWSISGMISIHAQLGDAWPACADDLTPEMSAGLAMTRDRYGMDARAKIESRRTAVNDKMAQIFDEVDFVITATNPDVAFAAAGPLPNTFGGIKAGAQNNGRLTFPANLHGNPAISIPAGLVDGLPVSLQVVSRHFSEPLLLDLALSVERNAPWQLMAPGC